MYQIESFVIYRQLSVCKIEKVETPSFESDKTKLYYRLRPVFENKNDTTVYVPIDSEECLRPLSQIKEVNSALSALSDLKACVCAAKKPPQLAAHYQELLTGGVMGLLTLLKEIAVKEKTCVKKLSEIDVRFRNKTERLLSEEFAILFNLSPQEAKEKIYKSMNL